MERERGGERGIERERGDRERERERWEASKITVNKFA